MYEHNLKQLLFVVLKLLVLISTNVCAAPAEFEITSSSGRYPSFYKYTDTNFPSTIYHEINSVQNYDNGNVLRTDTSISLDCQSVSACHKIFLPVCGTDDRTYSNKCILEHESCLKRASGNLVLFKHNGMC